MTVTNRVRSKEIQVVDLPKLDIQDVKARSVGEAVVNAELYNQQLTSRKISIVINYCNKDLRWIESYINQSGDNFNITDITVYSKCNNENVKGIDAIKKLGGKLEVLQIPNVGRCDHTYAYWIHENFATIDTEDKGLVFFVKDNNYAQRNFRPFKDVFFAASTTGHGCVLKLVVSPHMKKVYRNDVNPKGPYNMLMFHDKSLQGNFALNAYPKGDRYGREAALFPSNYSNLKEYIDGVGLKYPSSEYIPVCYGTFRSNHVIIFHSCHVMNVHKSIVFSHSHFHSRYVY